MKNLFVLSLILFAGVISPRFVHASSLSCSDIDGASVFGYTYNGYEYIGSISNPYGSDSIANEYGSYGSEYSSKSMFNDYSNWGNEYSSYSAFNDYTSRPPILVNSDYEIVGYVTTNDYKYPSINPYIAKACADDSWRSAISEHEDLTFDSESDLSGYASHSSSGVSLDALCKAQYGIYSYSVSDTSCACLTGYEWGTDGTSCVAQSLSCPANSSEVSGSCYCNTGYVYNSSLSYCIDYNTSCQMQYGSNVYGDADYCYCNSGYQWNSGKTACAVIPAATTTSSSSSPSPDPVTTTTGSDVSLLGGQYDSSKYDASLVARLKGSILLQVEEHGEAWYIYPSDSMRYYMKDGATAYSMMRSFGLGITDKDLATIPSVEEAGDIKTTKSVCLTNATANRVKGTILLQVEQHGEAWYVDPNTCARVYMKDGSAAYSIMRELGLGITNTDLTKMPSGDIQ